MANPHKNTAMCTAHLATNNRFREQNVPFGIAQQDHLLRE
jgi:hypothetical protein